jgi:hypothetical protein
VYLDLHKMLINLYKIMNGLHFQYPIGQELLVEEITGIIRQEAIPLTFDGTMRFLNFSKFGRQGPTFISLVRDPLDPRIWQRYSGVTPHL